MRTEVKRVEQLGALLGGRELVIVSNREPYTHRAGKSGLVADRPAGGLVAALDPVMQMTGGTWIAWGHGDADFLVTDERGRVRVPQETPRYTLKRIALRKADVEGYYRGYSNEVLWPLCHLALEHLRLRSHDWEAYQAVNRRFAETVAAEASDGAVVWLHDYHLATCARALRSLRPDLFLMQFWHTPWPAWDVFRVCPERAAVLDGLLANDLLAFQRPRYAAHFFEAARRELGAPERGGVVTYAGQATRVHVFPISVDVEALAAAARSRECAEWQVSLSRRLGLRGRRVVVSVDRLDYTKGILHRLRAIEMLLSRRPDLGSRLVFVQKTAAGREDIPAYRELRASVEHRVAALNATYGTEHWQPVVHLPGSLPPAGMAALYRMADACLVTPVADGMNLVAKEFVACQEGAAGVLLLSEFAGAHDELTGALSVNPYDAEACAAAIARALEMPERQRRQRMKHLWGRVVAHDVYDWMGAHLEAAADALGTAPSGPDAVSAVLRARSGKRALALFLDFDGTLAPFDDDPGRVRLSAGVRAMLGRLAEDPEEVVCIVTGRSLADIQARVGLDEIGYVGNHGLEIHGRGGLWVHPEAEDLRPAVAACASRLEHRLADVPGAWVESKGLTLTVHHRRTPGAFVEQVRDAVFEETARELSGRLAVHLGTQAFEVRPDVAWNKGEAVKRILADTYGPSWAFDVSVVYIGDDWTDEDAFEALTDTAVTVKVGRDATTAARCRVPDVRGVHEILAVLAGDRAPGSVSVRPEGARTQTAQMGAGRNGLARGASGPLAAS